MVMKVNDTPVSDNVFSEEECENVKHVVSRYGVQVVCNEEDEAEQNAPDLVLPASEGCENVKKVASKIGYQVVCEEE